MEAPVSTYKPIGRCAGVFRRQVCASELAQTWLSELNLNGYCPNVSQGTMPTAPPEITVSQSFAWSPIASTNSA